MQMSDPKQLRIKILMTINVSCDLTVEGTDFLYPEDVEVLNQMIRLRERWWSLPSEIEEIDADNLSKDIDKIVFYEKKGAIRIAPFFLYANL